MTDREYVKDWSPALGRHMELLSFGRAGLPLLVFPTSMGRFYQWEDFGMVDALRDKIDAGFIRLICVDSVDEESWYANGKPPRDRVLRHLQYERYLLDELISRLPEPPLAVGTRLHAAGRLVLRQGGALGDRLGDCAPQHGREVGVEKRSLLRRERDPLPHVRDRACERADADGERECVAEISAPRLEVRVAQPREPRVAVRELCALLEEPEGDDKGRKRM